MVNGTKLRFPFYTGIPSEHTKYWEKSEIEMIKNGYGDMVLMSMETYEHLINGLEMDNAIAEAEAEYAAGAAFVDAR